MTDLELADWEARHDSVIAWEKMWFRLNLFFFGIVLFLLFFTEVEGIALFAFIATQLFFSIAHIICIDRHQRLHEEFEE